MSSYFSPFQEFLGNNDKYWLMDNSDDHSSSVGHVTGSTQTFGNVDMVLGKVDAIPSEVDEILGRIVVTFDPSLNMAYFLTPLVLKSVIFCTHGWHNDTIFLDTYTSPFIVITFLCCLQ
jgi:hypothetical protein